MRGLEIAVDGEAAFGPWHDVVNVDVGFERFLAERAKAGIFFYYFRAERRRNSVAENGAVFPLDDCGTARFWARTRSDNCFAFGIAGWACYK